MELVLFGDSLIDIRRFLRPVDLYILTLLCKHYRHTIAQKDIRKATVVEINMRIDTIFGVGFMQLLRNANAIITGPFIAQCMLGEMWKDSVIRITIRDECCARSSSTKKWSDNWDDICTYLAKYLIEDKWSEKHYKVNGINVILSIRIFIFTKRKTYYTATDSVVVKTVHDIFTKHTSVCSREGYMIDARKFFKMHNRGLKFYEINGITLTDAECHQKLCKPISITAKQTQEECEKCNEFKVRGNVIYTYQSYPAFDIDPKSQLCGSGKVHISKCTKNKKYCITCLLYPSTLHYDCRTRGGNSFILIPKYV